MAEVKDRKLVLEDGRTFAGAAFGGDGETVSELVFNTAMVGYQEVVSDPSFTGQAIVMTYPLIGNYGMTDEDFESKRPFIGGLIVRDYSKAPSNFRYTQTLEEFLQDHKIPGISGVDTRMLTRIIRDEGTKKALITAVDKPMEQCLQILRDTPLLKNPVKVAGCKKTYYSRTSNPRFNVVAIDCGMKQNMIRKFNEYRCNVTIMPHTSTAAEVMAMHPDGVFFSNGPGDPKAVPEVQELIRGIRGKVPMFGICFGHQLICLAYGADTFKLKFGHIGGNHPVRSLKTGKVEITSQNHGYAVVADSLAGTGLTQTHVNILDNTLEGVECIPDRVFSVQYHPESAPGPQDSEHLFRQFTDMMKEGRSNA